MNSIVVKPEISPEMVRVHFELPLIEIKVTPGTPQASNIKHIISIIYLYIYIWIINNVEIAGWHSSLQSRQTLEDAELQPDVICYSGVISASAKGGWAQLPSTTALGLCESKLRDWGFVIRSWMVSPCIPMDFFG